MVLFNKLYDVESLALVMNRSRTIPCCNLISFRYLTGKLLQDFTRFSDKMSGILWTMGHGQYTAGSRYDTVNFLLNAQNRITITQPWSPNVALRLSIQSDHSYRAFIGYLRYYIIFDRVTVQSIWMCHLQQPPLNLLINICARYLLHRAIGTFVL